MAFSALHLVGLIEQHGRDNVLFIIPSKPIHFSGMRHEKFAVRSDGLIPTAYTIVDTDLYKLCDRHKVHLKSIDPRYESYTFFLSDLAKAIRDDTFGMFIKFMDGDPVIHLRRPLGLGESTLASNDSYRPF